MFCDNCRFYQLEEVSWQGIPHKTKLCQAMKDDICPATATMENDREYEGDRPEDKALSAGLHPTELHWID